MKRPEIFAEILLRGVLYFLMCLPYILIIGGLMLIAWSEHDYIGFATLVLGLFIAVYYRKPLSDLDKNMSDNDY